MVRSLKYSGDTFMAEHLITLTAMTPCGSWLRDLAADYTLLPVPMATFREWRRGFNQSALLADALRKTYGFSILPADTLRRIAANKPQARNRNRRARMENLSEAYLLKHPGAIHGKRILIIDDVMTSGATCALAADALKAGEPADVCIFTVLRARLWEDEDDAAEVASPFRDDSSAVPDQRGKLP